MRFNLSNAFSRYFLVLILLVGGFQLQAASFHLKDSVGTKRVNGTLFILHEIEAGQTLYAVSRKYDIPVDRLFEANPDARNGLNIGQVIKVPVIQESMTENGMNVHIVEASQTLYSISRQYKVSVADLKKWNKLTTNALDVGQKLIIKDAKPESNVSEATAETIPEIEIAEKKGRKIHIVAPSQTLYAISRLYKVNINDIKKWNKLTSNEISIGQKLIVSFPQEGQTLTASTENMTETTSFSSEVDDEMSKNKLEVSTTVASNEDEEETNVVDNSKEEIDTLAKKEEKLDTLHIKARRDRATRRGIDKVVEYGLAEVIGENVDTKKYLALHRTAPIGTVMRVRNDLNNRTIFVRVLGRLPDTGDNEKIVIKISRAAFDKLGGINNRFPVEMSYVP